MDLRSGYILGFDSDYISCILSKDYETDEVLSYSRILLTDEEKSMVSIGLIIRYNKDTKTIEFIREDETWTMNFK